MIVTIPSGPMSSLKSMPSSPGLWKCWRERGMLHEPLVQKPGILPFLHLLTEHGLVKQIFTNNTLVPCIVCALTQHWVSVNPVCVGRLTSDPYWVYWTSTYNNSSFYRMNYFLFFKQQIACNLIKKTKKFQQEFLVIFNKLLPNVFVPISA